MVKFFETLKDFVSYDEEVFPCELVVSNDLRLLCEPTRTVLWSLSCLQQGWSLEVELVIGGRGIRQRTQKNSAVSMLKMLTFKVLLLINLTSRILVYAVRRSI